MTISDQSLLGLGLGFGAHKESNLPSSVRENYNVKNGKANQYKGNSSSSISNDDNFTYPSLDHPKISTSSYFAQQPISTENSNLNGNSSNSSSSIYNDNFNPSYFTQPNSSTNPTPSCSSSTSLLALASIHNHIGSNKLYNCNTYSTSSNTSNRENDATAGGCSYNNSNLGLGLHKNNEIGLGVGQASMSQNNNDSNFTKRFQNQNQIGSLGTEMYQDNSERNNAPIAFHADNNNGTVAMSGVPSDNITNSNSNARKLLQNPANHSSKVNFNLCNNNNNIAEAATPRNTSYTTCGDGNPTPLQTSVKFDLNPNSCNRVNSTPTPRNVSYTTSNGKPLQSSLKFDPTSSNSQVTPRNTSYNTYSANNNPPVPTAVLLAKIKALESERMQLKDKVNLQEAEIISLKKSVNNNNDVNASTALELDFDPRTTKVLVMKSNPLLEAKKLKRVLQDQTKLTLAENNGEVRQQNNSHFLDSAKMVESLKENLKTEQIRNKRLKEAVRRTITQYREAMSELFGFQIRGDFGSKNTKFRLVSEYCNDGGKENCLEFHQSNDGTMSLLETEYSKSLQHNIDDYLSKYGSIPAFLSSVTLDILCSEFN